MSEESKEIDPNIHNLTHDAVSPSQSSRVGENDVDEDSPGNAHADTVALASPAKKKKSKKAKLKQAFGVGGSEDVHEHTPSSSSNPASKLTPGMVEQLLEMNPSLKSEVAGMDKETAAQALKKLDVADLLTGMVGLVEPFILMPQIINPKASLSVGRTKRTWPHISFGKHSRYRDLVSSTANNPQSVTDRRQTRLKTVKKAQ